MRSFPKSSMTFKLLAVSLLFGASWVFADAISISSPGITDTPILTPGQMYIANGTSDSKATSISVHFDTWAGEDDPFTFTEFWYTTTGLDLGMWSGMWHKPNVDWTPGQVYRFKVTNTGSGESKTENEHSVRKLIRNL